MIRLGSILKLKLESVTWYWFLCVICLSIVHYNRFYPKITHPSLIVNDILFGLLLLTTPILIIISKKISNNFQRKFCLSVSIFINIILGLRFILFLFGVYVEDYQNIKQQEVQLISSTNYKNSQIKFYDYNCGATCSNILVIRKETPLFLNFQMTKELYREDHCLAKETKVNTNKGQLELITCMNKELVIPLD